MSGRILYRITCVAALVIGSAGWGAPHALGQSCSSVVTSYDFSNGTATYAADVQNWSAQSFELTAGILLGKITLLISNVGATGDTMMVQIRTGGPSVTDPPGSTVIATSTISDANASAHLVDFTFPGTPLSANTPYYIVVTSDGANTAGYDLFVDASSPTFTPGQSFSGTNGVSWSSRSEVDLAFELRAVCQNPAPVLSAPMLLAVGMTLGILGLLFIRARRQPS
ncbi:MAG: hypothetical protein HY270_23695 [Deltaproteobacteria bacterium]|nr:hypothetical protein [Deltaproteobacteria bacterium]